MPTLAGPLFVLVFTLSQAFRDVYFGNVFQRVDPLAVTFLAFTLSTVIFTLVALLRAPGDFRKLRDQIGTVLMVNVTTAMAWSSYFFALTWLDPSIVNTIHSAMGPLVILLLGAFGGAALAQRTGTSFVERIGYGGIALSIAGLWTVVLGGHAGFAAPAGSSVIGLALLGVSGTSITISLLYCKRLQDNGVGADALTAVRYLGLIAFAGLMILGRGKPTGIETLPQAGTLALAALLLLILPLYSLQVGIGRTNPLTASIVRALAPVLVFALEQFDGRLHYAPAVLACILLYSASVIVTNLARGWREKPEAGAVSASR
jgi:drug/metabolite transporter (DMT)-like permease